MPAEKSSPSRTASENAVRRSAPLISSAIEISEFQMTVSVMGSIGVSAASPGQITGILTPSIDLDHQMAAAIHLHNIAGKNDGRRFPLLDQAGSLEGIVRFHQVAVDDIGADHAAAFGEISRALTDRSRSRSARR